MMASRFRLAALQIEDLVKCRKWKEMQEHLDCPPSTLFAMYDRILLRLDPRGRKDARKVLLWLAFSVHKLDGRQDVPTKMGQELEDGTVLSTNDEAVVNECNGGGHVVASDPLRPERLIVLGVPESQYRIFRNRRNSRVRKVEFHRNQWLDWMSVSIPKSKKK